MRQGKLKGVAGLMIKWLLVPIVMVVGVVSRVQAANWTPLITSSWSTGIVTDLGTVAAGILSCVVIILGIGMLVKGIMR